MTGSDKAAKPGGSDLPLRVASALVLIPLALAATWYGGWPFALLWLLAGIGVWWEWCALVDQPSRWTAFAIGVAGLVIAALALEFRQATVAGGVIAAACVLVAAISSSRRVWSAAGVLYAGAVVLAPVFLRQDPEWGIAAIVLLFAVVWGTDTAAYFGGRGLGGPKLMPAVSPKKTWSGAISGILAAIILGPLVGWLVGAPSLVMLAVVSALLSAISQAGDLFESWMKRVFGVKDSGNLIPGHGGLMDRLDGFVFVAFAAVAIGLARAGLESPSRGLLIW